MQKIVKVIFLVSLLSGCGGGGSGSDETNPNHSGSDETNPNHSGSDETNPNHSSGNQTPTANAGADQNVSIGTVVALNGSDSNDPDGDLLNYMWSFTSVPSGSNATLTNGSDVTPTFTPDVGGRYIINLIVNDGELNSDADQIIINASTLIKGIISNDTVLNSFDSPYLIDGLVQIAYGVTLTINPGVEINDGRIEVFGALSANGNADEPIEFNNVSVSIGNNKNKITEPAMMDISFANFQGGGLWSPSGNAGYGSLQLRDSILNNTDYIYLWYPTSSCFIERNIFLNAGGISVGTKGDTNVYIRNNFFYRQSTDYAVKNWVSYNGTETIVENNSFVSIDRTALRLPAGYNSTRMTGYNNYWGTDDESVIESMIFDKNDDLSSNDYVPFKPHLLDHHLNTPIPSVLP